MVADDLITRVTDGFKHGKRRGEIKEDLLEQGYSEEDIDHAIAKIQHEAIKQLPGISWIYRLIDTFESKANLTTPQMTIVLMIACIALLLALAGGLYYVFDPLGTQATARDSQRQDDVIKLQNALSVYYQKNHMYPSSLSTLIPDYLSSIPLDPRSGNAYSYRTINRANSYVICITYELQPGQCMNAPQEKQVIPLVPTDTPIPSFVPQSASGTPNYHAM